MGTLWHKLRAGDSTAAAWQPARICNDEALCEFGGSLQFVSLGAGSDTLVVLLVAPESVPVHINGDEQIGGLKVLAHRDEILCGGQRYYYSAQSRPSLSPFALGDGRRRPRCPVCRMAIDDGQMTVCCPQCGRTYHQLPATDTASAKACWTYREQCLCSHPTALGEDAAWRPEWDPCCE
jgi:hypothetical protein